MVAIPRELYEILKTRERWPSLTISLAILLILFFCLQQAQIILKEDYGLIPALALSRPWTFITSIFLHSSFVHLFYNLVALGYYGFYLECATNIKRRHIFSTFFLSGIVSGFVFMITAPAAVIGGIGASGAILGLLGMLILVLPSYFLGLGILIGMGEFLMFDPSTYSVHLTGLAVGIFLSIYWRVRGSPGFT